MAPPRRPSIGRCTSANTDASCCRSPLVPSPISPARTCRYKREAIALFSDLVEPATWDTFWHWRLRDRNVSLITDPAIVVFHEKHFTLVGFAKERYHYARSFAARRVEGRPIAVRFLLALATPLLPPWLWLRIAAEVLPKGRHRRAFARASLHLALFTVIWAFGECVGYVRGAGDSLSRID